MHFDCRFKRDHQGNDHSVHVLSNKNPSKCVKPVLSPSPTREAPGSLSVSKSSDSSAHDCFRKSYKDFCAGHPCAIQYQHFPDWRWKGSLNPSQFFQVSKDPSKILTNKSSKTYQNISKHPIRLSHWKKATTSRPKESSRSCWCSSVFGSPSKGSEVFWSSVRHNMFFFQVTTCSLNDHVKKLQKTLL